MEINSVGAGRADISEMLSKIKEVSNRTKIFSDHTNVNQVDKPHGFDSVMSATKGAVASVNDITTESDRIKDAYISGDGNVSMAQVVLASQKSKIAFEGLVTVRNKILEAYKEVMNMPV